MNTVFRAILAFFLLTCSPAWANGRIFDSKAHFVMMGASQFLGPVVNQHHDYSEQEIEGKINVPICGFTQGLSFAAGYAHYRYDWSENPYFAQKDFQYVKLSAGVYCLYFADWIIAASATVWVDPEEWDFGDYAEYGGGIFARYAYNCDWTFWLGLITRGGLEDVTVLPVIGFNYCFCDSWKLNIVMPINISLEYCINECWFFYTGARVFLHRHRLRVEEPIPAGIFRYRNIGGEFGLKREVGETLEAKLFAGWSTGGSFKTMDKDGEFPIKNKFHTAPYGGASLQVKL